MRVHLPHPSVPQAPGEVAWAGFEVRRLARDHDIVGCRRDALAKGSKVAGVLQHRTRVEGLKDRGNRRVCDQRGSRLSREGLVQALAHDRPVAQVFGTCPDQPQLTTRQIVNGRRGPRKKLIGHGDGFVGKDRAKTFAATRSHRMRARFCSRSKASGRISEMRPSHAHRPANSAMSSGEPEIEELRKDSVPIN